MLKYPILLFFIFGFLEESCIKKENNNEENKLNNSLVGKTTTEKKDLSTLNMHAFYLTVDGEEYQILSPLICKEGKCEMPLGVDRVGYKKIQKPNTPMCYNCQDKSQIGLNKHKCCHQQLNVINSGPSNLKSADYMFYNDSKIRKDNKIILQTLGLKANPTL